MPPYRLKFPFLTFNTVLEFGMPPRCTVLQSIAIPPKSEKSKFRSKASYLLHLPINIH